MSMNQQPWGHLTPESIGTKFTWTIDNFTSRYTTIGDKFSSTVFFTGKDYKDEWCLELYPKGQYESDKDYVCVALKLLRTEKEEIRVDVLMYSIGKPDTDGSDLHLSFPIVHQSFSKTQSNRATRILDYSKILDYIKNDIFEVSCEITCAEFHSVSKSSTKLRQETGSLAPRMIDQMWMLFEEPQYSDTIITVEDKQFHVHQLLLKIRCPVFAAMFEHDLSEKQTNEIKIEGIKPEVVRKMLQFIYTDKIDNIEDIVRDLLVAADRYSLDGLTVLCEQVLCEQVAIDNAVSTLILAERYHSKSVKKHVAKFINGNLPEIVDSNEYKNMEESHPALVSYLFREMATSMIKSE